MLCSEFSDDGCRVVRQETLSAGTDLRDRLSVASENYQQQGYTVGELRLGQCGPSRPKGRQAARGGQQRGVTYRG